MSRKSSLCGSIKNVAFVSVGYFDYSALVHGITGFILGALTSTIFCNIMI